MILSRRLSTATLQLLHRFRSGGEVGLLSVGPARLGSLPCRLRSGLRRLSYIHTMRRLRRRVMRTTSGLAKAKPFAGSGTGRSGGGSSSLRTCNSLMCGPSAVARQQVAVLEAQQVLLAAFLGCSRLCWRASSPGRGASRQAAAPVWQGVHPLDKQVHNSSCNSHSCSSSCSSSSRRRCTRSGVEGTSVQGSRHGPHRWWHGGRPVAWNEVQQVVPCPPATARQHSR